MKNTPVVSKLVKESYLGRAVLIICVLIPVYPIVTVLQSVGGDEHLCPQRLGSLCYDPCDLLNLGQLHLKPLVHVIILWRRGTQTHRQRSWRAHVGSARRELLHVFNKRIFSVALID